MSATLYASLGYFTGLDNVTDPVRLATEVIQTPEGHKAAYPLVEAMNVDIDNSFAISSRSRLTELFTGANLHSFWANRKETLCYFMDGSALYRLNSDCASGVKLVELSSNSRVSFAEFNDRVYLTNGVDIGYVKADTFNRIPEQTLEYKQPLPAGNFIGVFDSRLYVAVGTILFIGDVLADCYDTRYGFRVFDSDIRMLVSVDKGLYVSDKRMWFLHIGQPSEVDPIGLHRLPADSAPAIPYTGIQIDGGDIGETGLEGIVGVWASESGICVGDNSGKVTSITGGKYVMSESSEGSAVMRDVNGVKHYLVTLRG